MLIQASYLKDYEKNGTQKKGGSGKDDLQIRALRQELDNQKDFTEKQIQEKEKALRDTEELKQAIVSLHEVRVTLNSMHTPQKQKQQSHQQNNQQFWNQDYKHQQSSVNKSQSHSSRYKSPLPAYSQYEYEMRSKKPSYGAFPGSKPRRY